MVQGRGMIMGQELSPVEALQQGVALYHRANIESKRDSTNTPRRLIRIGEYWLIFSEQTMGEILDPAPPIHRAPNSESWFSGAINVRGNIVPVFDLHALLGVIQSEATRYYMFVFGSDDSMVALLIDSLPEQRSFNELCTHLADDLLPDSLAKSYIQSSYFVDGQICFDLDLQQLFTSLVKKTEY